MSRKLIVHHKLIRPVVGTSLTILCSLALWGLPRFEGWRLASYDSLFRFATRAVTNRVAMATGGVAIVFMDNSSYERTGQFRTNTWDRARHAKLLDKLADDGCPLVVFDVFFGGPGKPEAKPEATGALLASMKRLSNVVLMARQTTTNHTSDVTRPGIYSVAPSLPSDVFLVAARSNWGVGSVSGSTNLGGQVVRQHWRFPSPGIYDSLAWTSAKLAGARLSDLPEERWIRYYAMESIRWRPWISLSYVDATVQTNGYFRDKFVFVGNKPIDNSTNVEIDKFTTPLRWSASGHRVGGVEILATEFLNLVNGEWLRRPPPPIEISILVVIGVLLGWVLRCRGRVFACLLAIAAGVAILFAAGCLSYYTNYWFPWLVIAGGQLPVALAFALLWPARSSSRTKTTEVAGVASGSTLLPLPLPAIDGVIDLPDYELVQPPIGEGAYGKVWLARNAVGQWQALKIVYRAKFGEDQSPYEREFRGIESYKRVSDAHPGLLRVDFVSRMRPQGYFYYAMELGDAATPGWELNPANYHPLDLAALCSANQGRLPPRDCARIGAQLCDALHFLHSQELAHRDIKPRNIIFVNGQPKLADVGLVADVQRPVQDITWVGTPGYMPPPPEPPGTAAADIYGLGMVLYVISTGCKPSVFPELSETLVDRKLHPDFNLLSPIIFHACHPDRMKRPTAIEMKEALLQVEMKLQAGSQPAAEPF